MTLTLARQLKLNGERIYLTVSLTPILLIDDYLHAVVPPHLQGHRNAGKRT